MNARRKTILDFASSNDAEGLARALKNGAKTCAADSQGRSALHLAALHSGLRCCRMLAEAIDPALRDAAGNTPAMCALRGGDPAVAKFFLSLPGAALPNLANENPLHRICALRGLSGAVFSEPELEELAHLALAAGCDPNMQNAKGQNPFMIAIGCDAWELACALLPRTDLNAAAANGQTALDMLLEWADYDRAEWLCKHMNARDEARDLGELCARGACKPSAGRGKGI